MFKRAINARGTNMDAIVLVALVAAVISTAGLVLFGLVDIQQLRGIRALKKMAETQSTLWEERGDFGEQLNSWLMARSEPDKPTNLEVVASLSGQAMAASFRNSIAGEKSGDVRLEQGIEKRFQDYLVRIDPKLADLAALAEAIGIDPKYVTTLGKVVQKYASSGLLGVQNDGQKGGTW